MSITRVMRNFIGERFKPVEGEQSHWCAENDDCRSVCRADGLWAPVILHTVNFGDWRHDPNQRLLLNYSDGAQYAPEERRKIFSLRGETDLHPGTWPYSLVEVVYEGLRRYPDGSSQRVFERVRFRIDALHNRFSTVANEIGVDAEKFADFVRRHADPNVADLIISKP